MGATRGLPLARGPRRRRRRSTQGLQPRSRHVRGRAATARRRPRDRSARVIGVLVSGAGTNLQALLDAGLPVVAVASNRRDAAALERARHLATESFELRDYASRAERDQAMADWL